MSKGTLTVFLVVMVVLILVIAFGAWVFRQSNGGNAGVPPVSTSASSTSTVFDQTISDGTLAISFPSADFGLATNQTQLLVHSYIPPCDPGFNYCLYYIGTAYQGTNFESAGVRIQKRKDITTERLCLNTPPAGYDAGTVPDATSSADAYSASVFNEIGGAAAGHMAAGTLYRVYAKGNAPSCYELETRIGQSQFANYPSGTIQQFTDADQLALQSEVQQVLATLQLASGTPVVLPQ